VRSERKPGYVDPTITPRSDAERALLAEIVALGLALHRVHPKGPSVRLSGPGVFLMAASLGTLVPSDLRPGA
jgi:hypothetical protein